MEEIVAKPRAAGAGFDPREVDVAVGERFQEFQQQAGVVGAGVDDQRGLAAGVGPLGWRRDGEKPGGVGILILNILGEDLEVGAVGRVVGVADTGDRGVLARGLHAAGGAGDGLPGCIGVVFFEIATALGERLRVAGDGVETVALCEQRVADRCDDLADDSGFVIRQRVERLGDAALDTVLDGDDAAFEIAVGNGLDDRGHRLAERHVVGDSAGGSMRVGSRRAKRNCVHWVCFSKLSKKRVGSTLKIAIRVRHAGRRRSGPSSQTAPAGGTRNQPTRTGGRRGCRPLLPE